MELNLFVYMCSIPINCAFLCIKVFPQEKGQDVSHTATKNMKFYFCVNNEVM